ncbi:MAG TPA: penicillin-binding transpeptidase domain-containing protein [Opitutaceae bacterium]|nr:penicillin-binding transpeptidase domain-containing protein [Opitutaceae bacterium]
MAAPPERSGRLVESKAGFDPRIIAFHGLVVLMLLVLACGLAYQQLIKDALHHERERQQNERRVIVPGPRGNIYDRDGRLLVGNRPRFAVVLNLDELRPEFRKEYLRIHSNYRQTGEKDIPDTDQLEQIAHASVVERYLDQVNTLLGRFGTVDSARLRNHLRRQLLLPYTLVDDLKPEEFARLIEHLPVNSPLQVYTSNTRYYPYGAAAAHVLGYVGANEGADDEDFPGEGLTTLKVKGTIGRDGLEKEFDPLLQGEAGYTILRVDPAGYKVNPPIEHRLPVQGHSLSCSLDVDLQAAAEDAIGDETGAAVAMDVRTGEVLVMASKPSYDLNAFSPHLSVAAAADIEERKAWTNIALNGVYSPGSTFKIVVSTAALLSGAITPRDTPADCQGSMMVGNRRFACDNGLGHHGILMLPEAIAESCDVYFWTVGLKTSADVIAAEARRFRLDRPTGIELPGETHRMLIPDPAWKKRARDESWTPGDTANMAIGQGDVQVTPLVMACFAASFARAELWTKPTLVHDPARLAQHTEPVGLSESQRAAVVKGMEGATLGGGTASILTTLDALRVPGVRIAGKTGTAQIKRPQGEVDEAWFICFAPLESPEIAVAVAVEGDVPGENFAGGRYAVPVASAILKRYFGKKRAGVAASAPPAGPS